MVGRHTKSKCVPKVIFRYKMDVIRPGIILRRHQAAVCKDQSRRKPRHLSEPDEYRRQKIIHHMYDVELIAQEVRQKRQTESTTIVLIPAILRHASDRFKRQQAADACQGTEKRRYFFVVRFRTCAFKELDVATAA